MKVHKPQTNEGFFLRLIQLINDVETEKIINYQKENKMSNDLEDLK